MFGTDNLMHVGIDWLIGIILWKIINYVWIDGKLPFQK